MEKKRKITHTYVHKNRSVNKGLTENVVYDSLAPLSILRFKSGTLHAAFHDCWKSPGIYGSLWMPIQLLDMLKIENGLNVSDVRFAAQFCIRQIDLDRIIAKGNIITLNSDLSIIIS